MRMIEVNVFNTEKTVQLARLHKAKKYFAVSTDKAANPANLMGATKRVMERFLFCLSALQPVSTARFANVAFSDGSLLHGFNQRILKQQPLSAPNDVRRYFLIPEESGELCLLSTLLGENRDTFFPKLSAELNLITFSDIAIRYLEAQGFSPVLCDSEDEARRRVPELQAQRKWPVYFFASDTTGEKPFEEFYTSNESIDLEKFQGVGIIHNPKETETKTLEKFKNHYKDLIWKGKWEKADIVKMIVKAVPELEHEEKGRYLDSKM
jgi:FlaA1/EpsC-like NDP-sugar epimerase